MHDPETLICRIGVPNLFRRDYQGRMELFEIAQLWHRDPCKGGHGDDSCGWFKRVSHEPKGEEVVERVLRDLKGEWSRTFSSNECDNDDREVDELRSGRTYYLGMFMPNGTPRYSAPAIVINTLFRVIQAHERVTRPRAQPGHRKVYKFIQNHLAELIVFAENPTDSLKEAIEGTWTPETVWDLDEEDDFRKHAAPIVRSLYGWYLRKIQPWWRHPRWHIHHWHISFTLLRDFRRVFTKCSFCSGRLGFRRSVTSYGDGRYQCSRCSRATLAASETTRP